jgi:hypothetical protein
MAACATLFTIINQRSCAFKFQIIHFDKLTKRIFSESIVSRILNADFDCHIILRIVVFVTNGQNFELK